MNYFAALLIDVRSAALSISNETLLEMYGV
jgi:hypothetical protein